MTKLHRLFARIAAFATVTIPAAVGAQPINLNQKTLLPEDFQQNLGLANQDLKVTVARLINVAMGLLGIVAVVIILIGGFKWMTSGGDEEKAGDARKLIFAGVIGLAIILSAFAIAKFVIDALLKATAE